MLVQHKEINYLLQPKYIFLKNQVFSLTSVLSNFWLPSFFCSPKNMRMFLRTVAKLPSFGRVLLQMVYEFPFLVSILMHAKFENATQQMCCHETGKSLKSVNQIQLLTMTVFKKNTTFSPNGLWIAPSP